MLERIFEVVLNMSITASVAAVLIMFFRLLLGNRLPKIFSYALWAIVLLRLLLPFNLPSKVSLFNAIRIPDSIVAQNDKNQEAMDNTIPVAVNKGTLQKNTAAADLNSSLPVKATENPIELKPELIIVALWLLGAVGLLLFSTIAYIRASKRLKDAVLYKNDKLLNNLCAKLKLGKKVRIYTSDRINSPIVYGLARASVILPLNLSQSLNESELTHILAHELVHIKRSDHIMKPLSVLALCIHWFNPLVWISFALSQKDMEIACDEKVMSSFDNDIRSEYAGSLIKLASRQNLLLNGGVLAFGESNIKRRVKSIMNYKKPQFWIVSIAIAILAVFSIVLLTNGQSNTTVKNITSVKDTKHKQISDLAKAAVQRNITDLEENPEVKIKDSKITRLELIKSFDKLTDVPVEVYALEYRILPEDPKKVVLAGGMSMDENGWLRETSSAGSPLLVVSTSNNKVQLLATIWTGTVQEEGGLEACIKRTLKIQDNGTDNKNTMDKLLSIIISSPSASSSTGDYIKAHQKEADEIVDMGEKALPYLKEILDSGDKGLRGNVVWLLCERIIKELSGNVQSPQTEKLVKEATTAVDKWKVSMGYDKVSDTKISEDLKKLEVQEDEMLSQVQGLNSIIKKLSSSNKYSGSNMKWPVPSSGKISSAYGMKYHPALNKNREHTGIDIPASANDSIVAANDGTVILACYKPGYGNTVIIDHGGSIATLYGHCSSFSCSVGDKVKAGEVIAKVGSTGLSTGPHCHFEVRVNGETVNPLKYCKVDVK